MLVGKFASWIVCPLNRLLTNHLSNHPTNQLISKEQTLPNAAKKRILQLVASSQGGAATHVRDLAQNLSPDRYEVSVAFSLDEGNIVPADFTERGISFTPLSIAGGMAWREISRLRHLYASQQVDLVHMHGARAALYGRLAALLMPNRPKIIFSIHGFASPFYGRPKRTLYLTLERALQTVTDQTIAVAQAEADLFTAHGLTSQARVSVISYGIDVGRFAAPNTNLAALRQSLQLSEKAPIILTVCRINIPRDFDSLLKAFANLSNAFDTARLLIVGDGPQRPQVEAMITELGLDERVQITGYRDDIPDLMALADIYTLTSYGWEGYPISTMEAQAAGVPVVVTDAGGSAEAVLHQQTGLVVPKRQPAALAAALQRLLADAELRQKLGHAGQERAKREFTYEAMMEKIEANYEHVLA